MTAHQMLKLLDEEADRASVLTRFVAELKPEDEQLLTDLLERTRRRPPTVPEAARRPRSRREVMIWVAAVPFVIAGLLGLCAERLARRMRPSTAVRLLTGLALSVSLCTGLVLSAAAVLVCAQWGPLPRIGGWSASTLRTGMGLPIDAGLAALIVVVSCLTAAIVQSAQAVRALLAAGRSANQFEPAVGRPRRHRR